MNALQGDLKKKLVFFYQFAKLSCSMKSEVSLKHTERSAVSIQSRHINDVFLC